MRGPALEFALCVEQTLQSSRPMFVKDVQADHADMGYSPIAYLIFTSWGRSGAYRVADGGGCRSRAAAGQVWPGLTVWRETKAMSAGFLEGGAKANAGEVALLVASSVPGMGLPHESRRARMQLAHLARLNTLGQMAASLAHEINQPLGAIALQAELLTRQIQLGRELSLETVFRAGEFIAREAHRAGELIRRIRQFAQKAGPRFAAIQIGEIVGEALSLAENQLLHEGIQVHREIPGELPAVRADLLQIEQVLLNLVRNAIEAMATSPMGERHLRIRGERRGQNIVIEVSDTGSGLSPQAQEHLFEAFFSTKPTGVGIGLAISRSIVESHGGRLWCAPNTPRGTTFAFSLPLAEPGNDGN